MRNLIKKILRENDDLDWINTASEHEDYAGYYGMKISEFIERYTDEWDDDIEYIPPPQEQYSSRLELGEVVSTLDGYESVLRVSLNNNEYFSVVVKEYRNGNRVSNSIEIFTDFDEVLNYIIEYLVDY